MQVPITQEEMEAATIVVDPATEKASEEELEKYETLMMQVPHLKTNIDAHLAGQKITDLKEMTAEMCGKLIKRMEMEIAKEKPKQMEYLNMSDLTMEALQQGSSEWHALRSRMIRASDAASIMGIGFLTPLQLWEQKMGFSQQEENWAMFRGKEMEPEARAAYESHTGEIMFPSVEISMQHPWAMASLDGINLERTKIVEIKCPGREDHAKL